MTGAKLLRILLERQGIETISGIPGGAILPFYDELHGSRIKHVLARHEQGAGFIAQGMARVSGKAAVCVGTSGPGATNLLTAIADAYADSIPLIAITGQVSQALMGTRAFQEVDMYGLSAPITKKNFLVSSVEELPEIIPLAFRIAESGRPGPVSIDIPKDVLLAKTAIKEEDLPEPGSADTRSPCATEQIIALAEALNKAKHPIIYLGGGIIASGASGLAVALAHRISAPAVSSLMALGAMPPDDPLNMGMLGMHGSMATNLLMEEADFLLAIGARFDDRATGKVAAFCQHAMIAHIDIDKGEIGKIKPSQLALEGDAKAILTRLLDYLPEQKRSGWTARATRLRTQCAWAYPSREEEPLHPANLCRFLGEICDDNTIITTDVGQHQMWMAQAYPIRKPRTFLTSGGLGTMGFGLPVAIGAALAAPDKRIVCVSGDGSILMNIQELATLAELNLSVTIVIFNNAQLGMVCQQQEILYNKRYSASQFASVPDFAALAQAFGIRGVSVNMRGNPLGELEAAINGEGPCLIDVAIDASSNVLPMVPPGAANRDMIAGDRLKQSIAI